jgi:hypothetical protein
MTAPAPLRTRSRRSIPGRRFLTVLPLAALTVALAADLGSVALVKLSASDDAGEAARAGVGAIQYERSATPQTAQAAYDAAEQVASLHRLDIDQATFVVHADGKVELTAHRTAPTVLFKHLPGLRNLTETTVSVTADRAEW